MNFILALSGKGQLQLLMIETDSLGSGEKIVDPEMVRAFSSNIYSGLMHLAKNEPKADWSETLLYWRSFVLLFLKELSLAEEEKVSGIKIPSAWEIEKFVNLIPDMRGARHWSMLAFRNLWLGFFEWIQVEMSNYPEGFDQFLIKEIPGWDSDGKICFNLTELKDNDDFPFAFMATLIVSNHKKNSERHLPLYRILEESNPKDKSTLQVVAHMYKIAQKIPWIKSLLETHEIFYPQAWTADQAYKLLVSIPLLKEAGLRVKVPNWWKKRIPPKIQFSIGTEKTKALGLKTLLDFNCSIVLGSNELSLAELNKLNLSGERLVRFKGEWIEINNKKIQEAIDQWHKIEKQIQGKKKGYLTFSEGMRLLAQKEEIDESQDQEEFSLEINTGEWFQEILEKLRDPKEIPVEALDRLLLTKLRPYQKTGVSWMYFITSLYLGGCLADDMGLGKTIQVIALLLLRKERAQEDQIKQRSLLVVPVSLIANWQSEINSFAPSLKVLYFHLSEMDKAFMNTITQADLDNYDLVITSYGTLMRWDLLSELEWDLLILDEVQAIKNPAAKQSKIAKQIIAKSRLGLTGTPIENSLVDLWSIYDFVSPGLLGNFKEFGRFLQSRSTDKKGINAVRRLIAPYIMRRRKTDSTIINDLPKKTEQMVWCGLTPSQVKIYKQLVDELAESIESKDGNSRQGLIFTYLIKLKQVCNHTSQILKNESFSLSGSGKFHQLKELAQLIAEKDEKMIVFTQFREMTEPLHDLLKDVFQTSGFTISGKTKAKDRKKYLDQFQRENGPPFFVLSLRAGGFGINLTAANHVVHFDRWWNPAVENQATDRIYRIGQRRAVLVHKFICRGTVEEKIHNMITDKISLADDILERVESEAAALTSLTDSDLIKVVQLNLNRTTMN